MYKIRIFAILCAVVTLLFTTYAMAAAQKLNVVASFSIIGDLAQNVGGDRVNITTLIGPNGDVHVYEPKPADAAAVAQADVVLVNGLHLEGFLQRLINASGTEALVVRLTDGVAVLGNPQWAAHPEHEHGHHQHGKFDPHAWQSVRNAEIYVDNIADAFCVIDVDGCDIYRANAKVYETKLASLDHAIRAAVAGIPKDKRVVITTHDGFAYFQYEYGITFLAPVGISTASAPSATDVAKLIRQVRNDHASAIFMENITNPRLIEQIADETGIRIGGTLYSDALSAAGGPAATYIDMMRHNVNTIKSAIDER